MKITVKELKALIREAVAEQYGYRGGRGKNFGFHGEKEFGHGSNDDGEREGKGHMGDYDELTPEEWADALRRAED
jgi:hypothetical protein